LLRRRATYCRHTHWRSTGFWIVIGRYCHGTTVVVLYLVDFVFRIALTFLASSSYRFRSVVDSPEFVYSLWRVLWFIFTIIVDLWTRSYRQLRPFSLILQLSTPHTALANHYHHRRHCTTCINYFLIFLLLHNLYYFIFFYFIITLLFLICWSATFCVHHCYLHHNIILYLINIRCFALYSNIIQYLPSQHGKHKNIELFSLE